MVTTPLSTGQMEDDHQVMYVSRVLGLAEWHDEDTGRQQADFQSLYTQPRRQSPRRAVATKESPRFSWEQTWSQWVHGPPFKNTTRSSDFF
jgi:hypothetical protein